jgi:hypothetical protein
MKTEDGEYKPNLNRMVPCANYEAIKGKPEVRRAVVEAACEVDEDA